MYVGGSVTSTVFSVFNSQLQYFRIRRYVKKKKNSFKNTVRKSHAPLSAALFLLCFFSSFNDIIFIIDRYREQPRRRRRRRLLHRGSV